MSSEEMIMFACAVLIYTISMVGLAIQVHEALKRFEERKHEPKLPKAAVRRNR